MEIQRRRFVLLCGLMTMISFLYVYDLLFISIHAPDREEQFADRRLPYYLKPVAEPARRVLFCLAIPAWMLTKQVYEPYYAEVVYYPLLAGVMWFGYGFLLAWSQQTGRLTKVSLSLMGLWALFIFMGVKLKIL